MQGPGASPASPWGQRNDGFRTKIWQKMGPFSLLCGNAYKTWGFLLIPSAPRGENVPPGTEFWDPGGTSGWPGTTAFPGEYWWFRKNVKNLMTFQKILKKTRWFFRQKVWDYGNPMKHRVLGPPRGALGGQKMNKIRAKSAKFRSVFVICGNAY